MKYLTIAIALILLSEGTQVSVFSSSLKYVEHDKSKMKSYFGSSPTRSLRAPENLY